MSSGAILQMLGSLLLVVLLILVVAMLLKRMPGAAMAKQGLLRLRGSVSVGVRERVVLVDVGDKTLVLGVAPGRVSTLHVLDQLPEQDIEPSRFAELLKREPN